MAAAGDGSSEEDNDVGPPIPSAAPDDDDNDDADVGPPIPAPSDAKKKKKRRGQ